MTDTTGLLEGIFVLDLTRVLAGPYCTMMLADLGADVVKVEAPERGDDTRAWGPPFTANGQSAYFLSANRNKRSLTLNLKSEEGIAILKRLIAKADVLVENFKAGTLAGWGLDEDALNALRPGLIYATITGYGYSGPYAERPGYDFMVQAMGGLMSVTGPVEGEPVRVGIAIADLATGIFASNAILAALFARERNGKGQRIDMALLDSQVALMSYVASNYLVSGELPGRYGNGHPNIVPYQSFKASDGYFAFAAGNDGQWVKFCAAAAKTEWAQDERFATNQARVGNRAVLIPMLDELFATRTAEEWMRLCDEAGIPAAPIQTMADVFAHPQVAARGLQRSIMGQDGAAVPQVASPLNIPTAPTGMRLPPPLLGEHTDAALAELLGMDGEQIAALRAGGVV
jgi:crotonobetainyl-CoA:carnitine CoA-transferase CaiB-like acyl-CoA transferase